MTRVQALRQAETNLRKKAVRRLALANTTAAMSGWIIPVEVFRQMVDAMPIAEDAQIKPPTLN